MVAKSRVRRSPAQRRIWKRGHGPNWLGQRTPFGLRGAMRRDRQIGKRLAQFQGRVQFIKAKLDSIEEELKVREQELELYRKQRRQVAKTRNVRVFEKPIPSRAPSSTQQDVDE